MDILRSLVDDNAHHFSRIQYACKSTFEKIETDLRVLLKRSEGIVKKFDFNQGISGGFPDIFSKKKGKASTSDLDLLPVTRSPEVPETIPPENEVTKPFYLVYGSTRWQTRDKSTLERTLNVASSLIPLLAVGCATPRVSAEAEWFGRSIMAAGIVSFAYHATAGELHENLLYTDFVSKAVVAMCMTEALNKDVDPAIMIGSSLLLPFKPTVVSAFHNTLLEVEFFKRAKNDVSLRPSHKKHLAAVAASAAFGIADESLPGNSFVHAAKHVTFALSLVAVNNLLKQKPK